MYGLDFAALLKFMKDAFGCLEMHQGIALAAYKTHTPLQLKTNKEKTCVYFTLLFIAEFQGVS